MRVSLLLSGLLTIGLGAALYVLEIPFGFSWSIPLILGGVIIMGAAVFAKESEGHVEPPEGYRFCPFCSSLVPLAAKRCDNCNGLLSG